MTLEIYLSLVNLSVALPPSTFSPVKNENAAVTHLTAEKLAAFKKECQFVPSVSALI